MKFDSFNRHSHTPPHHNSLHFSEEDLNIVSSFSQLPLVKTSITLEEAHLNLSRLERDRDNAESTEGHYLANRDKRSDSVERLRTTMLGKAAVSKSQYFQRLLQEKSHQRELFGQEDNIDAQIDRLEQVLKKRFTVEEQSPKTKMIDQKKKNTSQYKTTPPFQKPDTQQTIQKPHPYILISKDDTNSPRQTKLDTQQTISPRSKAIKDQDKNTTKKKNTKKKMTNSNWKTNRKTERSTHPLRIQSVSMDRHHNLEALTNKLQKIQHLLTNRQLSQVRKQLQLMQMSVQRRGLVRQIYSKLYNSVISRLHNPNVHRLKTVKTSKVLSS